MMNRAARATAIDPVSRLRIYTNLNPSTLSPTTSKQSEATLVFNNDEPITCNEMTRIFRAKS